MKKSIFILLSGLIFLAGDAHALLVRGTNEVIEVPSARVNGQDYLSLDLVSRAYGFSLEWDSFSKVAVLKRDTAIVKLLLNSDIAIVNDSPISTRNELLICKNVLSVPKDFAGSVLMPLLSSLPKKPLSISSVTTKPQAQLPPASKYFVRKVVIDAGHGGHDPGAIGRGGVKEKDIVLDVAMRLKNELEANGIEVLLTRDSDVFVPLAKRAKIANDAGADFFISVHANSSRARRAQGFEVYYLSEAIDDNARALEASENAALKFEDSSFGGTSTSLEATLWDMLNTENRAESAELGSHICKVASQRLDSCSRGVKRARFYVLKGANMPAVLIEIGFISNKKEEARLSNAYYRQMIAESLASGILNYKAVYEKTDGFTK